MSHDGLIQQKTSIPMFNAYTVYMYIVYVYNYICTKEKIGVGNADSDAYVQALTFSSPKLMWIAVFLDMF